MKNLTSPYKISPNTSIGRVSLSVSNLAASISYYQDFLGLHLIRSVGNQAYLGAGNKVLLELSEQTGGHKQPHTTGLYHFALLVPSRIDLALTLRHLVEVQANFVGFADHHVSEAIYLSDPDGHGIEIYRDRPKAEWTDREGNFYMTTDPLDIKGLLAEISQSSSNWQGIHPETMMGHIHLHVGNLQQNQEFYAGILGFDVMLEWGTAAFLSAGGYHHHLGMNTWAGVNAPAPSKSALRLLRYEILVPDKLTLQEIRSRLDTFGIDYADYVSSLVLTDPSEIQLALKVANQMD